MIKIIKKGNPEKALDIRYFKCTSCDCEWSADKNDYDHEYGQRGSKHYHMKCPTCRQKTYNVDVFQKDFEEGLIDVCD